MKYLGGLRERWTRRPDNPRGRDDADLRAREEDDEDGRPRRGFNPERADVRGAAAGQDEPHRGPGTLFSAVVRFQGIGVRFHNSGL